MGEAMPVPTQLRSEIKQALGLVPEWLDEFPDGAAAGFWTGARDFWLAETLIPNKYKEFIGLGVSAATRCRYCTLFHTEAAKLYGATPEEIAEANAMAGITMFGSTFINGQQIDYESFKKETRQIVEHVRRNLAVTVSA
jgi:AhpD family alkylhydroperoxidase